MGSLGRRIAAAITASFLALVSASAARAQHGATDGQWRFYNGDAGGARYAALDQIDADNVGRLHIAWRWNSESLGQRVETNFQTTPLTIDGVLYATAGDRRSVVAIDPGSGETIWTFTADEPARAGGTRGGSGRGVAFWSDGERRRILFITRSYVLISLIAETGKPDPEFGEGGTVDLKEGLGPLAVPGQIGSTSPPVVVRGAIVVGSAMPASTTRKESPPGHVRGFDARTGALKWTFHTIPRPGEFGHETWLEDSWTYTGNAGVWAPMSADLELGYVYLPLETPTVDFYGGHRPGDNLFAESLVCLDAATGRRVWHYQILHHGIWDYDLPTAPILCNIRVDGREVKAVAQVTKQGLTFVLDRLTGEPVWPIEERPVPQSDVPSERTAPTQPYPTKPAPFERVGVTSADLIDFTPELRAEAERIAARFRLGPIYTPPSLRERDGTQGTLILPGIMGGVNWPGAAFDPETGVLYIPSITDPTALAVGEPDPARSNLRYNRVGGAAARGPQGLPLIRPPWGRITAIDLNSGEHLWMTPNGDTPEFVRNHPALAGVEIPRTGQPGRAGALVTKSLLFVGEGNNLFAAAQGAGGTKLRAYDKRTGEIVSEFDLPAQQTGVPMSYMHEGRQYIVIAVGARNHPGELVALALAPPEMFAADRLK